MKEEKAVWVSKKMLLETWSGLNLYALNRFISEMRQNPKFSKSVINPTHKLVFIKLSGFEEFMRFKQKEYFKPKSLQKNKWSKQAL